MAVGAIFGAVNTMYAAVAGRTPEIAVLLTLGFHPRSVLASFLLESAIIAAIGGVIGCVSLFPVNGFVASTTNWSSFSEIAFNFRVTPGFAARGDDLRRRYGSARRILPSETGGEVTGRSSPSLTGSGLCAEG